VTPLKSFVIIGLGRFGRAVAEELSELGCEVLAIDNDMEQVERMADQVTQAVCCDATNLNQLKELGVKSFDCAVLAMGSDIGTSALVTLNLKELGIPQVICKACSHIHRQVLERIGADLVIFPEHEMGTKLAQNLAGSSLVNFLELSPDYGVVELPIPGDWTGKTIQALNIRRAFRVNIVAIRASGENQIHMAPGPDYAFRPKDRMIVVGETAAINALREK
jgi:trk system potassium uptake protein TrkA